MDPGFCEMLLELQDISVHSQGGIQLGFEAELVLLCRRQSNSIPPNDRCTIEMC